MLVAYIYYKIIRFRGITMSLLFISKLIFKKIKIYIILVITWLSMMAIFLSIVFLALSFIGIIPHDGLVFISLLQVKCWNWHQKLESVTIKKLKQNKSDETVENNLPVFFSFFREIPLPPDILSSWPPPDAYSWRTIFCSRQSYIQPRIIQ